MEAQQVIEPLRQRKPEVLNEAHMFVEEMARVSSLWDEQWMHSLQEVQVRTGQWLCLYVRFCRLPLILVIDLPHPEVIWCPERSRGTHICSSA